MNRFLRKKHVLSLALPLIAIAWGGLNWTGFCFSEFRYLSDEEFFERFLESNPSFLKPELWQIQNQLNDKTIRAVNPYKDAREYMSLFPDCCKFGWQKGALSEISNNPSIKERILGGAPKRVAARINWRYVDEKGQSQMSSVYRIYASNNCGKSDNYGY